MRSAYYHSETPASVAAPRRLEANILTSSPKWSYCLVILLSFLVGVAFLQEPGFGDDFTYWRLAFGIHRIGPSAWNVHSFHDLRWPIWGVVWLLQGFAGSGLVTYYGAALLYLAAGACLVNAFARQIWSTAGAAWLSVGAFLFAPILDPIVFRPMPDLPEAVFGACAVLAWWFMMQEEQRSRALVLGFLSGLSIGLAYSTRVTGIFITPVLAVGTLVFFRDRWRWLMVPAAVAALYFGIECVVYHQLCGEWLHGLTANAANRGVKGTEPIPFWTLPTRFINAIWHGNRLAPTYTMLAALGCWAGWRNHGRTGRMVVLWFALLYVLYTCSIQSIHPVRPLIGPTPRYLATMAVPFGIIVAFGVLQLFAWISQLGWPPLRKGCEWVAAHPLATGVVAIILAALVTSRPAFDLGYVPTLQARLKALPPGAKIFTHEPMRDLSFLVDASGSNKIDWIAPRLILAHDARTEASAKEAEEFWYMRKLLWMNQRKDVERSPGKAQPTLASYLVHPEQDWVLSDVVAKGEEPELIFYRRRPVGAPGPHVLTAASPELAPLLPALPTVWHPSAAKESRDLNWSIPPEMRGKLVRLEADGASQSVEPFNTKLRFRSGSRKGPDYLFKPIFHASGGQDFLVLEIPPSADRCEVKLVANGHPKEVTLRSVRVVYDDIR
jgi:hypothetical protein